MKPRDFFIKTISLVFGTIAVYYFLAYAWFGVPAGITKWINDCYEIKTIRAETVQSPKMVFIGGSGTHFGVKASDVQNALGIDTCNFGVHAGLPITYILERAKTVLKTGDYAVLPLEYMAFTYQGEISKDASYYLRTYDRVYFKSLPLEVQWRYISQTTPKDLWTSLKIRLDLHKKNRSYNSKTVNQYGDETANVENKKQVLEQFQSVIIVPTVFEETEGLRAIRTFHEWCKIHKVNMYLSYANTIYHEEYLTNPYQRYFQWLEGYFEQNGICVIGKPDDFFYPMTYFYDTPYHLNQAGVQVRTSELIEKLRPLINHQRICND